MERERAESLYDVHRNKVWDDIKSGTENFDRYLLSFSSGALGLSLAFIKDVVPLAKAVWILSLFASWIFFTVCIVITMASFQISIRAQQKTLGWLEEFYLNGNSDALNKHLKSFWCWAIDWCTLAATLCFAAGLICTMLFVGANVREARKMSEQEKRAVTIELQESIKPAAMTPVTKSLKPVAMTPMSTGDALKPVAMTPVATTQQPTTQNTPAAQPQSGQSSGKK
ncbi:MAG TPA: hypothetical protein VD837_19440 [Terriglobales bacterium]|nr:hypothetical protein [Terriglobales bacterium]